MEEFIKAFSAALPTEWKYVLGVVALLIVVVPRLLEFRQNFLDVSMGRRRLELEKLRLEVLKLRMDVQQLAKQQPPEVARDLKAIVAEPPAASPPPSPPKPHKGVIGWLAKRPRLGRPVLFVAQLVLAYMMTTFAVGTVAFPIVGWNEPGIGPLLSLVMTLVYAVFGLLSYKAFSNTRAIRKELAER